MNFSSNATYEPKNEQGAIRSFTRQFYETDVVCVLPDTKISEVAKEMRENHIGNVLVVDESSANGSNKKPVGIITDRDIVVKCLSKPGFNEEVTASEVMSSSIATVRETEGIEEMVRAMRENGVTRLPVINEQDELVGIVTAKKLLQHLISELNDLTMISERQQEKEAGLKH